MKKHDALCPRRAAKDGRKLNDQMTGLPNWTQRQHHIACQCALISDVRTDLLQRIMEAARTATMDANLTHVGDGVAYAIGFSDAFIVALAAARGEGEATNEA